MGLNKGAGKIFLKIQISYFTDIPVTPRASMETLHMTSSRPTLLPAPAACDRSKPKLGRKIVALLSDLHYGCGVKNRQGDSEPGNT